MFGSLVNFWKGKDFLIEVFDEFNGMLDDCEEMFDMVIKVLLKGEDIKSMKEKVYTIDKKVNCFEKSIRDRIAKHLLLQPSVNVTVCLLLMSVVKDAERLGDYSKNLFEIAELANGNIDIAKYRELFGTMEQSIQKLYKDTKKAFMEENEDLAVNSWTIKKEIGKGCDRIIESLAKSTTLTVNQAVCFTLMARHYKRIISHLTNIATSVVLPIADLDYYNKP